MRALVFVAMSACAATTPAVSPSSDVGAPPKCDEAERHRDLACDLAKRLCAAAADRVEANVARCTDGEARCAAARAKVGEVCVQGVSAPRDGKRS